MEPNIFNKNIWICPLLLIGKVNYQLGGLRYKQILIQKHYYLSTSEKTKLWITFSQDLTLVMIFLPLTLSTLANYNKGPNSTYLVHSDPNTQILILQ